MCECVFEREGNMELHRRAESGHFRQDESSNMRCLRKVYSNRLLQQRSETSYFEDCCQTVTVDTIESFHLIIQIDQSPSEASLVSHILCYASRKVNICRRSIYRESHEFVFLRPNYRRQTPVFFCRHFSQQLKY